MEQPSKQLNQPKEPISVAPQSHGIKDYFLFFVKKIITLVLLTAIITSIIVFYYESTKTNLVTFINETSKVVITKTSREPAKSTKPIVHNIELKKLPPVVPPPISTSVEALPVALESINLKTENNKTILDIFLSATTHYSIDQISAKKQLTITIENTNLQSNSPTVLDNSLITSLASVQKGKDVELTLNLVVGTDVEELELIEKPQIHLHLILSNPKQVQEAAGTSKLSKVPVTTSLDQIATQKYQQALDSLANNNVSAAISQLRLLLGDFPNHLQARETLAILLLKSGNIPSANDVLSVGLAKYPSYPTFIKLKARALAERGSTKQAIEIMQKYNPTVETDSEYFALLAGLYQQTEQYMLAASMYNELTKFEPDNGKWWIGLGLAFESANKKQAAREAYLRASESPDLPANLAAFISTKVKK